ncbi:metalloregulator ArsR/SmtB family transcription factor [Massilia sp. FT127W]|uniref:Metalloregulator ArsR/SmtB family transcription factor n=2 Tax=Pseudoduganella aquatica TaxID=2660641 RepID=A0A7X4KN51_9BURK|nr:metalloregulator ArsR/SmtB family transcription factor [Pseudoduganella aquatica]MYN08817.1 metalloregulator ArsR/SmtB family transcription factor [Pseudoduganella aquatica]
MAELFEEVSNVFFLLSEPTRLKILHSLCHGERAVNDIVTEIEASQANVSRQINMLFRAKILARRKEGTQVYYRIDDPATLGICQSVCARVSADILARSASRPEAQAPLATASA